ncbi:MAG: response regulator transcription factor [Chloroflexota bacterium]
MFRLLIIGEESRELGELYRGLTRDGFACQLASSGESIASQVAEKSADLVLLESNSLSPITALYGEIKQVRNLPVIALLPQETLGNSDVCLDQIDDFVVEPYDLSEVETRIKRLLNRNNTDNTVIKCGELVIDENKYEVSVGGRRVILTYKEYELLKFLAVNKGRVFTREVLLNKVWGYDYFGGDRTVDVHITRLRNKIEDATHTFIETVRNIGYRLRTEL